MIIKIVVLLVIVFSIGVTIMLFSKGKKSKEKLSAKGIVDGKLAVCFDKPNCVSTFEQRDKFKVLPIEYPGDGALNKVKEAFAKLGIEIVLEKDNYLHAIHTSSIFKFVDDIEILILENKIHFRSSSRIGYSDMGANKKRVEKLKTFISEN